MDMTIQFFSDVFEILAKEHRETKGQQFFLENIAWKVYNLASQYNIVDNIDIDDACLTLGIAKRLTSDGDLLYPGDDGY